MPAKTPLESKYLVNRETGCWVWRGCMSRRDGYGYVRIPMGGMAMAHRVVYATHRGEIPVGMQLDHLCRNRLCVNPKHLEPVTGQINTRRGLVTKLTDARVKAIRERFAQGAILEVISSETGISCGHLSEIIRGKYWPNSGGPIGSKDKRRYRPPTPRGSKTSKGATA